MEHWLFILMPFILLLARVSSFMASAPVFGSSAVPSVAKAGVAFWMAVFFAMLVPAPALGLTMSWLTAVVLVVQEIAIGLALGLGMQVLFLAIQQGGTIIAQQMGMTDAGVIDPVDGQEGDTVGTFMEMSLTLVFLAAGGHLLLVSLLARAYKVFPLAACPDAGALAKGLVVSGSAMLLMALKLAAPLIGAFIILAVVLAILARVLPEMNILFESYPLRIAMGIFVTAAILPSMGAFVSELAGLMTRLVGPSAPL